MAQGLKVVLLTPYPFEAQDHPVNGYVRRFASELRDAGHQVVVGAPTRSLQLLARAAELIREGKRAQLLAEPFVPLAEAPLRSSLLAAPSAVSRELAQRLHALLEPDVIHLHDPYPGNLALALLRRLPTLSLATFYPQPERLANAVQARLGEGLLGPLDLGQVTFQTLAQPLRGALALPPVVVLPPYALWAEEEPLRPAAAPLLFHPPEGTAARRLLLRALRRTTLPPGWGVALGGGEQPPGEEDGGPFAVVAEEPAAVERLAAASELVAVSTVGSFPYALRALAAGRTVVAPDLPLYRELLAAGKRGLLYPAQNGAALAGALRRALGEPALRRRLGEAASAFATPLTWSAYRREVEALYRRLLARRKNPLPRPKATVRIEADLHMHTVHSHDCATPVEALLRAARAKQLGAIAITDHNEIAGALEAQAMASEYGLSVIVGEEIKTAGEGEVIGLFLRERVEPGLSLAETIAQIRAQGGLIYVPHPFDRLHSVPDYRYLLPVVEEVDAVEVYNARVAFEAYNAEAARFAAKYGLPAGAGSDAHVLQGLGSARVRMAPFDGPEEFMRALAGGEIIARPRSLLYVQALKFLQTRGLAEVLRR